MIRGVKLDDNKHGPKLTIKNFGAFEMPHGSGIDYDWETVETRGYFTFKNGWHAMDQNGFYCGCVPFEVKVPKEIIKTARDTGTLPLHKIKIKYDKKSLKTIVRGYERNKDGDSNAPYLEDLPDIIYSAIESQQYRLNKREEQL